MNREIKFRAWDSFRKKMSYNPAISDGTDGGSTAWVSLNEGINGCDEILMQYTGLKDKGGVEIWENDIIEFDQKEWGGNDNIHIVSWDNENAQWSWGGGRTGDMEWRTVIGNIHQNPELLEK